MGSLSSWLQWYCLLKVIIEYNCYVLLAADAKDFRNIAKQIVPETLANKIARLASDISVKQNRRGKQDESDYYYESDKEDFDSDSKEDSAIESNVRNLDQKGEAMYVNEWKTRVNLDELVERVKERLAKELTEKYKKRVLNQQERKETQSIYNNFGSKEIQNGRIIVPNKSINYDHGNDQSPFKTVKTYGYNNYKNKHQPKEEHKNLNGYIETDNQETDQNMSPLKFTEQEHELIENEKYIYDGVKIHKKYEEDVTTNYETLNTYLVSNSKQQKYLNKGKQSKEMIHEEDNDFFHSQNNQAQTYGIEELTRTTPNIDLDKQYIGINAELPKYTEKGNSEIIYGGSGPMDHNYDDGSSQQYNADQNTFSNSNINRPSLYDEFNLQTKRKNDSYEDYAIPNIDNKYASGETNTPNKNDHPINVQKSTLNNNEKSRFKVQYNSNFQKVKPLKNDWQYAYTEENIKLPENYREVNDRSQEIKAKTESLWYNYDDTEPKTIKDDHSKDLEMNSKIVPSKKTNPKGTMIPTREYFKMVSPNYYKSLPTIVEKYDSKEPLPEKDRQREVIKHFLNPPASINKKVRLIKK